MQKKKNYSSQFQNPWLLTWTLVTIFGLFLASGCAGTKSTPPAQFAITADRYKANFTAARHLVFIGLDGWGGDYVSKSDMPTVKRMMARGASSLSLKCVEPSNSWPNWTALFSGSPQTRFNESREGEKFTTIFTAIKASGKPGMPAFFFEWEELQNICQDDEAEKIKTTSDLESAEKVASYITEKKPVFTAVVFNQPDSIGHSKRWGSKAYYSKLTELDSYIAVIEQGVKDAGIYDDTVFILSADHGGVLWGHGFNSPAQRKIPLIICGKGIKKGHIIPPGKEPRPSGSAEFSGPTICDIAPTMAAILGLETFSEWTGKPLKEIFE